MNGAMKDSAQADELENRLRAKHVSRQRLRSVTSLALNDAQARRAENNANFVHRLKIALKELNETGVWLQILNASMKTVKQ